MTTIVDQYKLLIKKIVYQLDKKATQPRKYSTQDLEQEAWLALLKAEKRFDPNRGTKFITYAYTYVQKELLKFICQQRKARGCVPVEESDSPFTFKVADEKRTNIDSVVDQDFVNHLKAQLSPYEQTIIDAKFNGTHLKDVAAITGVMPGQVGKSIVKTIDKLKRAANRELKPHENYDNS